MLSQAAFLSSVEFVGPTGALVTKVARIYQAASGVTDSVDIDKGF